MSATEKETLRRKSKQAAELKKAEKRKAEVEGLFAKMYEDWSAGRITEYNFNMLSEKYQNEQKELYPTISLTKGKRKKLSRSIDNDGAM